jgi:hypothetical protein
MTRTIREIPSMDRVPSGNALEGIVGETSPGPIGFGTVKFFGSRTSRITSRMGRSRKRSRYQSHVSSTFLGA